MRHRKKTAKLGRDHSHRKAMLANMVSSLLEHESISTTKAKARELRRRADNMITFAKRGDLHARRQVLRVIPNKVVVAKLFDELGPRYAERQGGYTRIVKTEARRGDGADMCIIELVDRPGATGSAAPANKRQAKEPAPAEQQPEGEAEVDEAAEAEKKG
jgi:large subunit ribosomal protein L17